MAKYIVSYDLSKSGANYSELIEHIRKYAFAKIGQSVYALSSNMSSTEIRDELSRFLDSNDCLFVAKISGWASWGISKQVCKWLKAH